MVPELVEGHFFLDVYNSEDYIIFEVIMKTIDAVKARKNFYRLIDETHSSHEPIYITGEKTNAVLVSEDEWQSIQETLYLLSIPTLRESIIDGMKTPLSECSEELDW